MKLFLAMCNLHVSVCLVMTILALAACASAHDSHPLPSIPARLHCITDPDRALPQPVGYRPHLRQPPHPPPRSGSPWMQSGISCWPARLGNRFWQRARRSSLPVCSPSWIRPICGSATWNAPSPHAANRNINPSPCKRLPRQPRRFHWPGSMCSAWPTTMPWITAHAGLADTQSILGQSGIATVGAGSDAAAAHAPVIIERNGLRLAFLAYVDVLPERFRF